jgi:putative nucleotidyltransferase with HDIG domain
LTIGIIGGEFAFEKEIFFELSNRVKTVISLLINKGIERIVFKQSLTKEELVKFIECLSSDDEKFTKNAEAFLSYLGVKNILVGKIKSGEEVSGAKFTGREQFNYYEESLSKVSNGLDNVLKGEKLDYIDMRFMMLNLIDNLSNRYQEFLKLSAIKRHDVITFAHLLNVSIISMYFSQKLGFSKDDFLDIGVAALFHDIGKIFISRKIIEKPDKLSDEEFDIMRSHSALGAQILLKYSDTIGILPVLVAFEHHLRHDLKGYPKLRYEQKPHLASQIVSICDVYDALTQRRSYKRDYPPDAMYNLMTREKGGAFQPALVDSFFKIIGVWPQGTILKLNDASVAIVRQQNCDDIFNPVVEVVFPQDKRRALNLKEEKIKIAGYISFLSDEAKPYLPLI